MWSWLAVAVNLTASLLMAPIIIGRLGDADYGIWTLVLSLVEYYWLIDLGLRSATLKYAAEYQALGQKERLSELLSTSFHYSWMAAVGVAVISLVAAPWGPGIFRITQPAFVPLLQLVGISWALGMIFNVFSGALEGMQRFEMMSWVWIFTIVTRSALVIFALRQGEGVLALGWILLITQSASYALTWYLYRRVLPDIRVRPSLATWAMMRRLLDYGVHTLTAQVATRLLSFGIPTLIAYFLPVASLAYYSVPVRILEYALEGVGRIGNITAPNATELMARGERESLIALGTTVNRYCLALYLPVAIYLTVYMREIYVIWLKKPEFVEKSLYLIPIFLIAYTVIAGQFNSISILFGIGRHKEYVWSLLIAAIITIVGVALVARPFGLAGIAWVVTALMVASRGVAACILVCRELSIHPLRFAVDIYARPLGIAAGTTGVLWWIKQHWLPGGQWSELIAAGVILGIVYGAGVYWGCLTSAHRHWLLQRLPWAAKTAA